LSQASFQSPVLTASGLPTDNRRLNYPFWIITSVESRQKYSRCPIRQSRLGMNVLIVDDSAAVRKILRRVLQQTGLHLEKIHEASDGLDALRCLRFNNVHLILLDVNMPKMDGFTLLRRLKRSTEWKDIPVIMITTESGQAKVMDAFNLGAIGYIRKPFSAEQIREKIERLALI
jgi:two-component system chemotaxis response regulator CheY